MTLIIFLSFIRGNECLDQSRSLNGQKRTEMDWKKIAFSKLFLAVPFPVSLHPAAAVGLAEDVVPSPDTARLCSRF
jgi:hypothetical protein